MMGFDASAVIGIMMISSPTASASAFVPSFEDNIRKLTRLFTAGDVTTCITTYGNEVLLIGDQDDSSVVPTATVG